MLRTVTRMQGQLGFEDMPRQLVRVTPARLATWVDCRRRYRMTYLDRPTPSRGAPWAHSTLGSVIHNALQAFFTLPLARRTSDASARLIRNYWRGEGFADPRQETEYREYAQRWTADYVSSVDADSEPIGVERWVSVSTQRIIAEGRVDRIDLRDNELVIVDYKTGRHAFTVEDARSSRALAMYAVAAEHTLRRTCRRVELHHLPTNSVLAWTHDAESLQRHVNRAETLALELDDATDAFTISGEGEKLFPPRTGKHCSWCDFRRHCPEGREAAPEVEPWAALVS